MASKLKSSLYVGPTIWFVPGGSNIPLVVAIMERIDNEMSANLTIALTDERFGPYLHQDSNWTQLLDAGFDKKQAKVIEVIKKDVTDLGQTISLYEHELKSAFENAISVIGQFGMGTDGHIAGIVPGSPADNDSLNSLVVGYVSQPFTRITLTFNGIRRINSAFLLAYGSDKHQQLDRLINQDLPLTEQPAQIIKEVRESYLYNDQLEGKQ